MATKTLDEIDRKILAIVQEDATTPLNQIAAYAGLSQTPCWRRPAAAQEEWVNEQDNFGLRGQLLWKPTTNLDITAAADREDFEHIRRKLKCSRCGANEARTIVLSPPPSRD